MAFSEFEQFRIEKAIDAFMKQRRPRPDIRHQFDLSARIERQSLVLYEVRPDWQDKTEIHEYPFAKLTYVRTRNCWNIFWMRANLKCYGYEPEPSVRTIDEALQIVAEDKFACFFG
ncbi:DUF3024 domain-containing protein [Rheinheimera marina]|uniref:DUF3024 domain-containing protein n=1 Tax=Rheinheimera marina TaxID=1774958 RepID=A0ABV9JPV5_9GAMM